MDKQKIVKVGVFASSNLQEARLAVEDLLMHLNHVLKGRGLVFELAGGVDEEDLAVVLYWRDFGDLPLPKFETAYESLKAGGNPAKIYVFFRESSDGIDDAMQAFKDSFAKKYGHFYCHFEHVDSVRFQLATQCLAFLPQKIEDLIKLDDGGAVSLGGRRIADLENLSFAKLNAKRKSLKRQIAAAEGEVMSLKSEMAASPDDVDLAESLREAQKKRCALKEELEQYDAVLFGAATFFAKASAREMDERVRKARELFEQGKAQAANQVLDLSELCASAERHLLALEAQRETCEKDVQALLAKAEIVLADASMPMSIRVDEACKAYDKAIRVARKIPWDDGKLAGVILDYACLLQNQHRFEASVGLFEDALRLQRRLAAECFSAHAEDVAMTLSRLAFSHRHVQQLAKSEEEYKEALAICRRLVETCPEAYEASLVSVLSSLACLHGAMPVLAEALDEYEEVLDICQRSAAKGSKIYDPVIAMTLNDLAILHDGTRPQKEREEMSLEALKIYRRLASEAPETYAEYVAWTLNTLAAFHRETDRLDDAERECAEALKIYQGLSSANPEVYELAMVRTQICLAELLKGMQRPEEATKEYEKVLDVCRRLAIDDPGTYEPYMALTLKSLANLHDDAQRFAEAERAYKGAIEIYCRLATSNSRAYESEAARMMNSLAVLYSHAQRFMDAKRECRAAVKIYRRLATEAPDVYESDLALTLFCLACILDELPRQGRGGVAFAEESLDLYRKCDARAPGEFSEKVNVVGEWLRERGCEVERN